MNEWTEKEFRNELDVFREGLKKLCERDGIDDAARIERVVKNWVSVNAKKIERKYVKTVQSRQDARDVDVQRAIDALLKEVGAGSRTLEKFTVAWNACVLDKIAEHTRIVRVARGTVEIEVDNHVLLHNLKAFQSKVLLKALQDVAPKPIIGLRFRIFQGS